MVFYPFYWTSVVSLNLIMKPRNYNVSQTDYTIYKVSLSVRFPIEMRWYPQDPVGCDWRTDVCFVFWFPEAPADFSLAQPCHFWHEGRQVSQDWAWLSGNISHHSLTPLSRGFVLGCLSNYLGNLPPEVWNIITIAPVIVNLPKFLIIQLRAGPALHRMGRA